MAYAFSTNSFYVMSADFLLWSCFIPKLAVREDYGWDSTQRSLISSSFDVLVRAETIKPTIVKLQGLEIGLKTHPCNFTAVRP